MVCREINGKVWGAFEESLLPPSSQIKSNIYYAGALATKALAAPTTFALGMATLPFALVEKTLVYVASFFQKEKGGFKAVLQDSRNWSKFGDVAKLMKEHPLGEDNPNFLFGPATCTYQDSGSYHCPNSQWAEFEKTLPENNRSGKSANLFELYQTDPKMVIDRIKQIGNSYRFSIEWSQIEPKKGEFDEKKLKAYVNFCKYLRSYNVTPMVTLDHFSRPKWFHDKGGFEKRENIQDFIAFVEKVAPHLTQNYWRKPLVEYICTINEPAIDAFSGYVRGAFPPGKAFGFTKAANFINNAIRAHCIAYDKIKALNSNVKVGYVHQYLRMEASNPLIAPITKYLTHIVNEVTLNYFKTGKFECRVPFFSHVVDTTMPEFKSDFLGVQYYVVPVIGLTGSTSYHEPMTAMPFREDPAHLYEAIVKTYKAAKKPIIVTENGISTKDEMQRARYMARATFAAKKAEEKIGKGNFLGYFPWCFTEKNFEWDMGMNPQRFGVFPSTADGKLAKTFKQGLQPFVDMVNAHKKKHAKGWFAFS